MKNTTVADTNTNDDAGKAKLNAKVARLKALLGWSSRDAEMATRVERVQTLLAYWR